ncbi:GNAT family N-acetyltransferase [Candidatus Obscuribacterales bacterium]|nr:GNAT family N-acetyltransferase [Candidatus Obscuribacterales bacterium]
MTESPLISRSIDVDYSSVAIARDGRQIIVRAIRPDDKVIFEDELRHLSPESRYFRFFTPKTELTAKELKYFSELDFVNHVGLIALIQENDTFVAAGTGRYIVCAGNGKGPSAEVAFEVKEEFQNLGIATILLRELTCIASKSGIKQLVAFVLNTNSKMLSVLRKFHWKYQSHGGSAGVITLSKELSNAESGDIRTSSQNHSEG